ncbi:hypothetical protein L484_008263 [Morus notabilis]|uniref:Uncharacterized protein n=1 Tax=Morus notabilis TaxID=981085 RepID=W9RIM9_9ROSA|nr:hypothetical protein L484_008263 [Morus notabilis]
MEGIKKLTWKIAVPNHCPTASERRHNHVHQKLTTAPLLSISLHLPTDLATGQWKRRRNWT